MALSKEKKAKIIKKFARDEKDTGSAEANTTRLKNRYTNRLTD